MKKYIKLLTVVLISAFTLTGCSGCNKDGQNRSETSDITNINKILQEQINETESEADKISETPGAENKTTEAASLNTEQTKENIKKKINSNALLLVPQQSNEIIAIGFLSGGYICFYNNAIYGGSYDYENNNFIVSFSKYKVTDKGKEQLSKPIEIENIKEITDEDLMEATDIESLVTKESDDSFFCKFSCENLKTDENGEISELGLQKRSMYIKKDRNGKYTDIEGSPILCRVVDEDTFYKTIQNYYKKG